MKLENINELENDLKNRSNPEKYWINIFSERKVIATRKGVLSLFSNPYADFSLKINTSVTNNIKQAIIEAISN